MRKPAFGVEPETSACRCGDRAIDEVNGFGERARPVRIGEAHAPWRTFGPRSDRPYLAHVDQCRRQARPAQQIDDAVRGVSLRDAVQRDCRAAFEMRSALTSRPLRPTFASVSASLCGDGPSESGLSEEK